MWSDSWWVSPGKRSLLFLDPRSGISMRGDIYPGDKSRRSDGLEDGSFKRAGGKGQREAPSKRKYDRKRGEGWLSFCIFSLIERLPPASGRKQV